MGVSTAIVRQAARTTTGTQDYTVSGFGTPKAAMFIMTTCLTDATPASVLHISIGAADGTRQWASQLVSADNAATTDTDASVNTGACITFSADSIAAFDSWITDGVRINWTSAAAAAYLVTCILFNGSDLSACVGSQLLTNAVDTAHDITTPGFEPDVLICSTGKGSKIPLGFTYNDRASGITQRAAFLGSRSGQATAQVCGKTSETYGCVSGAGAFSADGNCWLEIGSFDANGFTATTRIAAPSTSAYLGYIALKFAAAGDAKVYTYTTPTSTGSASDSSVGFKPLLLMMVGTEHEATETFYDDSRSGAFGISAMAGTVQISNSISDEDAADTTNTNSLSDDKAVHLMDHTGASDIEAAFTSFDANGFTLNWTNVTATAKKWIVLAIKDTSAAGPTPIPKSAPDDNSASALDTSKSFGAGWASAIDTNSASALDTGASFGQGWATTADSNSASLLDIAAVLLPLFLAVADTNVASCLDLSASFGESWVATDDTNEASCMDTSASFGTCWASTADTNAASCLDDAAVLLPIFLAINDTNAASSLDTSATYAHGWVAALDDNSANLVDEVAGFFPSYAAIADTNVASLDDLVAAEFALIAIASDSSPPTDEAAGFFTLDASVEDDNSANLQDPDPKIYLSGADLLSPAYDDNSAEALDTSQSWGTAWSAASDTNAAACLDTSQSFGNMWVSVGDDNSSNLQDPAPSVYLYEMFVAVGAEPYDNNSTLQDATPRIILKDTGKWQAEAAIDLRIIARWRDDAAIFKDTVELPGLQPINRWANTDFLTFTDGAFDVDAEELVEVEDGPVLWADWPRVDTGVLTAPLTPTPITDDNSANLLDTAAWILGIPKGANDDASSTWNDSSACQLTLDAAVSDTEPTWDDWIAKDLIGGGDIGAVASDGGIIYLEADANGFMTLNAWVTEDIVEWYDITANYGTEMPLDATALDSEPTWNDHVRIYLLPGVLRSRVNWIFRKDVTDKS